VTYFIAFLLDNLRRFQQSVPLKLTAIVAF